MGVCWGFFVIPQSLVVVGMIVIPLLVSGFLHFDGWCDTWDGFLALGSREKRLAIMEDSCIGVFVLAMGTLLLLFRFSLYPYVLQELDGVWFSWLLSRSSMVWLSYRTYYPKEKGTGRILIGQVPIWALGLVFFR